MGFVYLEGDSEDASDYDDDPDSSYDGYFSAADLSDAFY